APPDVEVGPVRNREDADVLALALAAVVEAPQLGPLVLRVPLAEFVAEAEHALLGAGLVLVAPTAPEDRVEAAVLDRVEQRPGLVPVAAFQFVAAFDDPLVDQVLDRGDLQPQPVLLDD